METFKYWLRWVAVLPGAFIAGFLLNFPLHWILYSILTGSDFISIEPYPELPERILSPFVNALGFVWLGARVAPEKRLETAVVLFGLLMLLVGASLAIAIFGGTIAGRVLAFHGHGMPRGLATVVATLGGLVGLIAARRDSRPRQAIAAATGQNAAR